MLAGDPKFEASQDLPGLPLRRLRRAARPARHPRRPARRSVGPAWDEALARRPAGGARGRSPTPRCRRCRRTSRFDQAKSSAHRPAQGRPRGARPRLAVGQGGNAGHSAVPQLNAMFGFRGLGRANHGRQFLRRLQRLPQSCSSPCSAFLLPARGTPSCRESRAKPSSIRLLRSKALPSERFVPPSPYTHRFAARDRHHRPRDVARLVRRQQYEGGSAAWLHSRGPDPGSRGRSRRTAGAGS